MAWWLYCQSSTLPFQISVIVQNIGATLNILDEKNERDFQGHASIRYAEEG